MTGEELHRLWTPTENPWSTWVKPVLFAALDSQTETGGEPDLLGHRPAWLRAGLLEPLEATPNASRVPPPYRHMERGDTALVIDLPGAAALRLGLALVEHRFQPVPLQNAVPHPAAIVDLHPILALLAAGAERMSRVSPIAAPAFLLDSGRMGDPRRVLPGAFDNRSVCRATDFPSPAALHRTEIRRAVLIQSGSSRPAPDLEPILLEWQRHGIALWLKRVDDETPARPFKLRRRFWPNRLLHLLRRSGLRRRDDGAYGALVPEPQSS